MPDHRTARTIGRGAAALLAIGLIAAGCSQAQEGNGPQPVDPGGIEAARGVRARVLVDGLEHPWGMAWLPDGDLLISERVGRLRLVRQGRLDPRPIEGVPAVFAEGQGGLLDLALHPAFPENRLLYLTYAAGNGQANQTRVARARLEGHGLRDVEVIVEATPPKSGSQHFGSRLLWLPDGTFLVSIGDGGNPPLSLDGELIRQQAQKPGSALGKILRFRADGTPAPDNPWSGKAGTLPSLWSLGHRNIQGLALDPADTTVWATEHGSRGGDELNRIEPGGNFGWPLVSHSLEYFGPPISERRSAPGLVDPVAVWTPAIAPSGLVVYGGERYSGWRGDLFAGGLQSQAVHRIVLNDRRQMLRQERIEIGARVRDVREGPDGFLYVLTDHPRDGRLLRLELSTAD